MVNHLRKAILLIVLFLFLLFLHHPSRGRREQRITWVNTNADVSKRKTRSAVRRCLPRSRCTMSTCFAGATVAGTMPRYHRADWQRNSAPLSRPGHRQPYALFWLRLERCRRAAGLALAWSGDPPRLSDFKINQATRKI